MAIHCKERIIPLTLEFTEGYGRKIPIKYAWESKQEIDVSKLVELKENMEIGLSFSPDSLQYYDKKAKAKVEMIEDGIEVHRIIDLQDLPKMNILYQSPNEYPWRMGFYLIEFSYFKKVYYTGFGIVPLYFNSEQIQKLHGYLEQKLSGAIHEKLTVKHLRVERGTKWYDQYTKLVKEHKEEISYFFRLLTNKTVTSIVGVNELDHRPGRMNQKSLQWQLKGEGKSSNPIYYNKVKKEVIDTVENRWMKTILTSWLKELTDVEKQLIREQGNGVKDVSALKHKVLFMLSKTFLAEIPMGNRKPLLKRPAYHKINRYYEKLKDVYTHRQSYELDDPHRFKKTWKLYEYYCVFMVIDAFTSQGFILKRGLEPSSEGMIPKGQQFVLTNYDTRVVIWYDKEVANCSNQAIERKEDIYCLGSNKRPDIRVDFYGKEESQWYFRSSMVLDAKFRRLDNIRMEGGCTGTQIQLFSYWQFVHISSPRPIVEKVICLYANDTTDSNIHHDQTLTYIKLFPDFETDQMIGREELIEEITGDTVQV